MRIIIARMDRLLFLILLSATQSTFCNAKYVFALIPKSLDNSFFDASKAGCEDNAQLLGVSCWFTAPLAEDASAQEELVESLLGNETISGVAISVTRAETMTAVINKLVQAGMPVVTFDSDAPDSKRLQYIGTDNFFFGQRLATILIQLKPYGGTFALLGTSSTNIQERIHGFKHKLREHSEDPIWTEIKGSPADFEVNVTLAMEQLQMFANQNPTAIIPMMGTPMNSGAWIEFVLENEARNITLLCGDAMPLQLEYLERGYVDGLLGQLPYEMGFAAIANLKKLVEGKGNDLKTIQGTNVLAHVKIPLVLPPLEVNENLLGGYVVVGLILFAIVTACSIGFIAWTMNYRKLYIVQASQPMFLIMVAVGTLILASTIVPMSFDDQGDENSCKNSDSKCVAICMSVPWLGCIGFTTAFGALYSKTARINKIFHQKEVYARVKVTERDVLLPYCIHMTANIIILVCWTIFDPLTYTREAQGGLDGWNRVIATYGSCTSKNVTPYIIPLALINVGFLILANYQAFAAREIRIEFSESKYIGIAMGSMLQACLMGMPILFLVQENPQAYYLVLSSMIFAISLATLLLIFMPKIVLAEKYKKMTATEQRQLIRSAIQEASVGTQKRTVTGSNMHGPGQQVDVRTTNDTSYPIDSELDEAFRPPIISSLSAASECTNRRFSTKDDDEGAIESVSADSEEDDGAAGLLCIRPPEKPLSEVFVGSQQTAVSLRAIRRSSTQQ